MEHALFRYETENTHENNLFSNTTEIEYCVFLLWFYTLYLPIDIQFEMIMIDKIEQRAIDIINMIAYLLKY